MKKIVWTINSIFPDAAEKLGVSLGEKGHWLYSLFNSIKDELKNKVSFHIIHFKHGLKEQQIFQKDEVTYYLLPLKTYSYLNNYKNELKSLKGIITSIKPDLVHIHGTEDAYGLITKEIDIPVIISIQGIRNEIIKYYFSDIKKKEYVKIILKYRDWSMLKNLLSWKIKTKHEREIIKANNYFIGRTFFDQACIKAMNPSANYLTGEDHRIIRSEFYQSDWKLENSDKYRIHTTLSESPYKGIFLLLSSIEIIKQIYPEIQVYIAGTFKGAIGKEVKYQIRKKKLNNNFCFLGRCNADQLINSMLKSRLFVLPSFIDNSPNSLQEAQILGMPVVASYTGGIPSLVEEHHTGLLFPRGDEKYLSLQIIRLIEDDNLAYLLGKNSKEYRITRNNPEKLKSNYILLYNRFLQH